MMRCVKRRLCYECPDHSLTFNMAFRKLGEKRFANPSLISARNKNHRYSPSYLRRRASISPACPEASRARHLSVSASRSSG